MGDSSFRSVILQAVKGYWRGQSTTLRRHTLPLDGFVSLNAPLDGGEMVRMRIALRDADLYSFRFEPR